MAAKFNFYLRDKNSIAETPIVLFVRYEGKLMKYSSKETVLPKHWNDSKQEVKSVRDVSNPAVINSILKNIKTAAEKCFLDLKLILGRSPSPEELRERIDLELKRSESAIEEEVTFLGLFDRFIMESENGIRLTSTGKKYDSRTIQKYRTAQKRLEKFSKKYKLTFDTIDQNFYSKFVAELNTEGYKLNSVGKHIMVIKTFMNYATENGYNSSQAFKKFKAYNETGFSVYLNESELEELYDKDFSKSPHLDRVRDLFLVGAWTGLRFSDFTTIQPSNIQDGFLHIKTFKTGERVVIPIHPTLRAIMAKYEGKYENSLPPPISNQKMNDYLKDIGKATTSLKADVEVEYIKGGLKVTEVKKKWEIITTHTARRSFATNVYKSGFPAISIMKITGHRTESAFLKYIKVTPEDVAVNLRDHWNKSVLKAI